MGEVVSARAPYVVVDSSVVFKWFASDAETSVGEAIALFEDHAAACIKLAAPAHMPAEVLNALACRPGLAAEDLVTAAEGLAEGELLYPAWDVELLGDAAKLAGEYRLTFYDALFPALAARLGCELVTADRAQARVSVCRVRLLA
jgi:predicted nucleic acid-binding protein